VRLGDDERVAEDRHPVGEREPVRDLSHLPVPHEVHRTRRAVELDPVDVDVPVRVDGDVVPVARPQLGEDGPVPVDEPPACRVDEHQPPVGQEVEAERQRVDPGDHGADSRAVQGEHLTRRPVRHVERPVVPARRLQQAPPGEQYFSHGDLLPDLHDRARPGSTGVQSGVPCVQSAAATRRRGARLPGKATDQEEVA
jgi:hypothetical protein